jgi:hypothetical protein
VEEKLDQHALAAFFGVTTRTLRNWIKGGELLEPIRIGRKQFWFKSKFEAWLRDSPGHAPRGAKVPSKPIVRKGRPRQPV